MSSLSLNDSVAPRPDFVLKLRIVGVGDSHQNQVRRVRLHRIQVDGVISYPALVDVAIKCTFPNAPLSHEEYDVGLTYYDIDNDCITIACTEELIDAIDQFSAIDRPVLKITTDVKRKEGLPTVPAPAASSRATASETPDSSPERPAQLPQLIESFVSVLSRAIEALQKQVAEVNQAKTNSPSTPKKEETAEELAKAVVNNIEMEEEKPKEAPSGPPRPFIHGRHTCNGCLCTPIIGARYHATNLDDYDLCAKCKDSYEGKEIHFEVAELDRDRPFQERWHRKRERLNGRGNCRPNGRGQGRHRNGPCRGPHARRGPPFRWQQEGMDKAFEEAVRRSLLEVKSTEGPTKPEPADSKQEDGAKPEPSAPADIKQEENTKPEPSAPADDSEVLDIADVATPSEEETTTNETEVSTVKSEEDIVIEEKVTIKSEETADSSFSTDAVGHGDAAEKLGQTLDECAQVIDAMVSELDRAAPVAVDDEASDDGYPAASFDETSSEKEAMIVDGEEENVEEDDSEKKSVASEDEWQVVTEDEQVASDEMIARAAQLIGSALFQSDLRSSEAGEATFSTLSESGNLGGDESVLSVPSSVPSVASGVSPAVLERWALQITQLHELGFDDDAKNVDILERLGAAKVGVDDEDEVSVAQVVGALLND